MRRIAVLSLFLCLVAVCRAQYIGSQYMNVKLGYIVDESQVQGTFGFGKVYKAFKVGANLNYRNLNRDLVKANTVTVGPELRGRDKAGNVAKPESGSFCRIQV